MGVYFGYMVPKPGGTHDIVVAPKAASQEVLSEFDQLTEVILDLQPLAVALASTEREYQALIEMPAVQEERLDQIGTVEVPVALLCDFMVEATRLFSGFLASASALLGHAEKYAGRVHGKKSPEGRAWHRCRRDLHASSLGYRLCYELRNFAQHYALPLTGVDVRGQLDATGRMVFSSGIYLSRDELLSSGYDWRQRVLDIRAQDPVFEVQPMADQYVECLRKLIGMLASYRVPELAHSRDYLNAVRRVLKAPTDARLWLFRFDGPELELPPIDSTMVPEEQLYWILDTLFRHKLDEAMPGPNV